MSKAIEKTIIALDGMKQDEVYKFLDELGSKICFVKIGLELYLRYGGSFVEKIKEKYNHKIFLDLKIHDIPQTVNKAISSLEGLPIDFLTIHLTGGREMMKQALVSASKHLPTTKLLGVTYLTSLSEDDIKEIWSNESKNLYENLLKIACEEKFHGLILSPLELELVNRFEKKYSHKFIKVTPGIRFSSDNNNDQKRIATPVKAFESGANYLVIGRPITLPANRDKNLEELRNLNV